MFSCAGMSLTIGWVSLISGCFLLGRSDAPLAVGSFVRACGDSVERTTAFFVEMLPFWGIVLDEAPVFLYSIPKDFTL